MDNWERGIDAKMAKDGFDPGSMTKAPKQTEKPSKNVDDDKDVKDTSHTHSIDSTETRKKVEPQGNVDGSSESPDKSESDSGEQPDGRSEGVEKKVKDDKEDLDSGGDEMPLEERKKLLLRDYHKKTTSVAQRKKELDEREAKLLTAAENVQRMYDYLQQASQTTQPTGTPEPQRASGTKFSTLPETEKKKVYAEMGLEIDEFTDANVIRAVDLFIEKSSDMEQRVEELTAKKFDQFQAQSKHTQDYERTLNENVQKLKSTYATLSKQYKLKPEAEFFILSHMQETRKHDPYYPIENAVRDYLVANGRESELDPDAADTERALAEPKRHPVVPSASASGMSKMPAGEGGEQRTWKNFEEAAKAAQADLDAGKLRHTRR
jgi:hypothetical protein